MPIIKRELDHHSPKGGIGEHVQLKDKISSRTHVLNNRTANNQAIIVHRMTPALVQRGSRGYQCVQGMRGSVASM